MFILNKIMAYCKNSLGLIEAVASRKTCSCAKHIVVRTPKV